MTAEKPRSPRPAPIRRPAFVAGALAFAVIAVIMLLGTLARGWLVDQPYQEHVRYRPIDVGGVVDDPAVTMASITSDVLTTCPPANGDEALPTGVFGLFDALVIPPCTSSSDSRRTAAGIVLVTELAVTIGVVALVAMLAIRAGRRGRQTHLAHRTALADPLSDS